MSCSTNWRCLGCCATVCCTLVAMLTVQAADSPSRRRRNAGAQDATVESTTPEENRLREGLKLEEEVGEFRDAGGRITFYPSNQKITLTVLENLALERVYAELEQRLERRRWSVSGVVTEYRGGNYLLITRAVMKPKAATTGEPARGRSQSSASMPRQLRAGQDSGRRHLGG